MENSRFKFRAWDKKSKKIREVISIIYTNISFDYMDYETFNEIKLVYLKGRDMIYDKDIQISRKEFECDLMQYTGLFDKQGVEIYEGDIVAYDDTPYNAHASILTGVIKMENHSFKLISIKPNSLGYRKMLIGSDDFFNKKSKVIGNIHENPELLEG